MISIFGPLEVEYNPNQIRYLNLKEVDVLQVLRFLRIMTKVLCGVMLTLDYLREQVNKHAERLGCSSILLRFFAIHT